jgi:hypothetical protein
LEVEVILEILKVLNLNSIGHEVVKDRVVKVGEHLLQHFHALSNAVPLLCERPVREVIVQQLPKVGLSKQLLCFDFICRRARVWRVWRKWYLLGMNQVILAVLEDERRLVILHVHKVEDLAHSLLERLAKRARKLCLREHGIGDPFRLFSHALGLLLFWQLRQVFVRLASDLQALWHICCANVVVVIRKHLLDKLRRLEDILELKIAVRALFCCLQVLLDI